MDPSCILPHRQYCVFFSSSSSSSRSSGKGRVQMNRRVLFKRWVRRVVRETNSVGKEKAARNKGKAQHYNVYHAERSGIAALRCLPLCGISRTPALHRAFWCAFVCVCVSHCCVSVMLLSEWLSDKVLIEKHGTTFSVMHFVTGLLHRQKAQVRMNFHYL